MNNFQDKSEGKLMNAEHWGSVRGVWKFKLSQVDEWVRIGAVDAAYDASKGAPQ